MSMDHVEQRLVDALRSTERIQPSDDLWARVLHSIDEDRTHRRRVARATVMVCSAAAGLAVVMLLAVVDGPLGRQVRLPVMELVETIALVLLVAALGRSIARFGRGYATDLWSSSPDTATVLVRLLDVAHTLVFAGYILLTADLEWGRSSVVVAKQVEGLGYRVAGLLLVMGLLHGLTIMVLPVVALVSNSTRVGAKLPRWLVTAMVVAAVPVGIVVALNVVGLIVAGVG